MKRGLITWNRDELSPSILEGRLDRCRDLARAHDVPALVVYSDVWRSNEARFLSNFMPYFNRSLLVVPVEGEPVLVCGLSPRVYPWIRSVTIVEDIRPGKRPAERVIELASEKRWAQLGVVAYERLPYELYRDFERAQVECLDVDASTLFHRADSSELSMRRTALETIRAQLDGLVARAGDTDAQLLARLDGALRKEGMEDLRLWISDATHTPRPARGHPPGESFSITVAVEYRGHWVMASRPLGPGGRYREDFERFIVNVASSDAGTAYFHDLSGAHPYQACRGFEAGTTLAVHLRFANGALYGDTCLANGSASATLL